MGLHWRLALPLVCPPFSPCVTLVFSSFLDNYVHRLVQNKGDGKLVEVMAGHGLPSEEKIDSLQLEVRLFPLVMSGTSDEEVFLLQYSYLLSSQLESQRLYFEEKMAHIEKDLTEQVSADLLCRDLRTSCFLLQLQVVESRCRTAVSEKERLETKVMELEKEKKSSDKKTASQLSKISKLTAELKEEKEVRATEDNLSHSSSLSA